MQATILDRSNPAASVLVPLMTIAALAALGWVLAYWTWAWFAPRPEPRAPSPAQADSRAVGTAQGAYALFGGARREGNAAAPAAAITLLGIVAASGGRSGYAVLRLDAKRTLAVPQGAEFEPGLRLVEVHVDHIVLERNGGREALAWPQKPAR